VHVLDAARPAFVEHDHDPRATRAHFAERGWSRVVAFQTESVMHRGDEHLTKTALALCDGLLLHARLGPAGADEVPVALRVRSYEALIRGYYAAERVLLALFPGATRFAGAREAVHDALVRKNYGCSHFIVGRGDASEGEAPGDEALRAVFSRFSPAEIGIEPCFFGEVFHSTVTGEMATEKTAPGDASTRVPMSSRAICTQLARGEAPPESQLRAEVAAILREGSGAPP
jgi:ATP sulfurylase